MPKVWSKSVRIEQTLWKRAGQEFCDACGMLIKDDHFWVWEIVHSSQGRTFVDAQEKSHLNMACSGGALLHLLECVSAKFG
jgi:hypothetical protein